MARERISTYHLPLANVPKGRYALANPEVARTEARKKLTRAVNRARGIGVALTRERVETEGATLKKGVVAFAQKAGLSSRTVDRLKRMNASELLTLYDENDILFESYFDYEGIEDTMGLGWQLPADVKARKQSQVEEFIAAYETRFGRK